MDGTALIHTAEWFFLAYFLLIQGMYLSLNGLALTRIRRHAQPAPSEPLDPIFSGLEPGVSVVIPTYNMGATILRTTRSLLDQNYPDVQVVVVNDGSTDDTMDVLVRYYDCEPLDTTPLGTLHTGEVQGLYRSRSHENLIVVDKVNGGKGDAQNVGINYARHDLVCMLDADSVLEPEALQRAVRPFLEKPETIGVGCSIFVMNQSRLDRRGLIQRLAMASNFWVIIQTLEYVRAFMFGRIGWAPLNAVPIISGAFGMFRKGVLIAAGGYRNDTVGEDLELTLRLHRWAADHLDRYRIEFVPHPLCWTDVPETRKHLARQRQRWHQGLSEALWMNRGLLFKNRMGWTSFPAFILFEWLAPVVELAGYVFFVVAWLLGILSWQAFVAFLILSLGMGVLISMCAVFLEELTFRVYPRFRHVLTLLIYALIENVGYRQLHTWWRLQGLWRFFRNPARPGYHGDDPNPDRGGWQTEPALMARHASA